MAYGDLGHWPREPGSSDGLFGAGPIAGALTSALATHRQQALEIDRKQMQPLPASGLRRSS